MGLHESHKPSRHFVLLASFCHWELYCKYSMVGQTSVPRETTATLDTCVKAPDVSHAVLDVSVAFNLLRYYTTYASDKRGFVSVQSHNHCPRGLRLRVKTWEHIFRSGSTPEREFWNLELKLLPLIF